MKKILFGLVAVIIVVGAVVAVMNSMRDGSVGRSNEPKGLYVAMGDSVAAGAGLGEASDSSACERSKLGYPNVVAKDENYTLTNVTCGGASIPVGIIGAQTVNNGAETPQLNVLFASEKPSLVTLTIGANDITWIEAMLQCIQQQCGSAADDQLVTTRIATMKDSLTDLLAQIKTHYGNESPNMVVVGYYQPVSVDGSCSENGSIERSEREWIIKQTNALNDALKQAADDSGFAKFASPDFSGHELCSANSYVQGILDKSGYHPTKEGEVAIAEAVKKAIR